VCKALSEARTKWQAQRVEDKMRDELFEGTYGKHTGEHLLAEFIKKEYLPWARQHKRSWGNDVSRARHITESTTLKGKRFADISPLLLEKFKRERSESITKRFKRHPHPATINHDLNLLSKVFSLAIENGITDSNPCRKVKRFDEGGGHTRYLLVEEEARLMAELVDGKAYLKPLIITALQAGMRLNEMLTLQWSNVDFSRDLIFVANPKWKRDPRKTKGIPISLELKEILQKQRALTRGDYVFPGRSHGHLSPTGVRAALQPALRAAGIHGVRFHDFRHTFGTRLGEAGISPFVIAELMGHADIKMTARYTHPTETGKRAAVEVLRAPKEKVGRNVVTGGLQQVG
jgi:integrase